MAFKTHKKSFPKILILVGLLIMVGLMVAGCGRKEKINVGSQERSNKTRIQIQNQNNQSSNQSQIQTPNGKNSNQENNPVAQNKNTTNPVNDKNISNTNNNNETNSTQTAITWVKGDYSVKLTNASLNNSAVKGILFGQDWRTLEPSEGNYNWATLDNGLQKIIDAKKAVSLNIMDTGARTPDWVKNIPGVQLFFFYDTNKYQSTYCQKLTLPVYWDSIFLRKRKDFINALADHINKKFGSNVVKGVMVSPFASVNNDWFIPHTVGTSACGAEDDIQEWESLGYSNSKMLAAAEETINDWAAAFPGAVLKLPIAFSPQIGGNSTDLAEAVVNWAYYRYPTKFYAQMNGFFAQTPVATDPSVKNATPGTINYILKLLTNRPQMGLQMLASATQGNSDGCRQNGKISPCPSYDVLSQSVNGALSYNPSFIEYWSQDADNPQLLPILQNAEQRMNQ